MYCRICPSIWFQWEKIVIITHCINLTHLLVLYSSSRAKNYITAELENMLNWKAWQVQANLLSFTMEHICPVHYTMFMYWLLLFFNYLYFLVTQIAIGIYE